MIRSFLLLLTAIVACLPGALHAEQATTWIKIASVAVDVRTAGTKTIALPDAAFNEFRFAADGKIAISSVKTSADGAVKTSVGGYTAKVGSPSASFFASSSPVVVKEIEIAWSADPASGGPVKLEVWAMKSQALAELKKSESNRGPTAAGGASQPTDAAKSVPPTTRGLTTAAPPPPPAAAPPSAPSTESAVTSRGLPPPSADAGPPKANACIDAKVCTIVDVFFGTDRNQVDGKDRISFGSERNGKLTVGHAFVTVPKVARDKGAIPLPSMWDKWVRGVPPEGDPARHFTIPKQGVTVYSTEDDFLAATRQHIATAGDFKDHAFIFIHGFYVGFDTALFRTAQIAYDLAPDGKPFGTAFMYSWPSAGDPTAYVYDQDSATFSAEHLQSFIRTVVDKTGVKNVHIIAHSMGNVALIGALQNLARTETKAKINQIILAAPDVDKKQFETIIASVEKVAKGITLYASQGDRALALARTARRGLPRAGESMVPPGPAIVSGIDTIDVSAISTAAFWGHDTYADSTEILADIALIFTKGVPPDKRSPKFQLFPLGALKYWKYAK